MKKPTEEYLGDGVYAVFDGYSITLDLRGQDYTTFISLDDSVLESLSRFKTLCYEQSINVNDQ